MTEAQLRYIHDRMCKKYRPRDCNQCPLSKWKNGCNVGIMMNVMKDWAKDNIDEKILEEKGGQVNIKELFRNIREARKELEILERKESDLTLSMLPGAIRYDKDKVDNSPDDPMLKFAERLSEIEAIKRERIRRLREDDRIAQLILEKMPTAKNRMLLELRYIEGGVKHRYSWAEVADEIGHEEVYTRGVLHQAALKEAQETYDQLNEKMLLF